MSVLEDIKISFSEANKIILLPHVNADGDSVGSCFALAHFLKKLGKHATVVFEEIPRLTSIVEGEYTLLEDFKEDYDLAVGVDCSDALRMGERARLFCGKTMLIDHHLTNDAEADTMLIDPKAAATGELIYDILEYIDGDMIDEYIARCLHLAISADTGCFKYSNVTAKTHIIASKLYKFECDFFEINKKLFDTFSIRKLKFQSDVVNATEFLFDNRLALFKLSKQEFDEQNLTIGDVEFVSSLLKTIEGVDVGAFIHEREKGVCKISLRTSELADASVIAKSFGGGGHMRAAGFSLEGDVEEVSKKVVAAIGKYLEKQ